MHQRLLYNNTLDTFPGAAVVLCAGIILVGAALNFLLYSQKWRIELFNSGKNDATPAVIEQKLDKDFQSGWANSSL